MDNKHHIIKFHQQQQAHHHIASALKSTSAMEKTPRYTQKERNMVLGYAAQYKDIIENKRTDAESNRKKDEVWRVIAKEFNARVYHQRTAKQLRQLYKNMKLLLKKDLSTDGRSESFIDILTALSQQPQMLQTFENISNPPPNKRIKYEENGKNPYSSSLDIDNGDVIMIKSEDLSENEDLSYRNDMDDDSIDNNIPEVCLEEDNDDFFEPLGNSSACNGFSNNNQQQNFLNYNQQQMMMQQQRNEHQRQQQQNHHRQQQKINNFNNNNSSNYNGNKSDDTLLSLAIEERKRKIELINAQIEYWKTLTKKIENSPACTTNLPGTTQQCSCHHDIIAQQQQQQQQQLQQPESDDAVSVKSSLSPLPQEEEPKINGDS